MTPAIAAAPPRQRILAKAEELFYRQGYQATGINQIIAESKVAKATFYAHFPSKDDLCLAYLEEASRRELSVFEAELAKKTDCLERFLMLIRSLEPWLIETHIRGCTFLNMVPEVPDPKSPLRQKGREVYRRYGAILERLAKELIASDRKKYGHLQPAKLASDYMTIFAGAIALAEIHHDVAPVRAAVKQAQELVG
jgi:AcrR family transcriptional regulator